MKRQPEKHNSEKLRARLIRQKQDAENLGDEILVVPSYENWNDFGYRIRAEIGLLAENGSREWFDAFFAIKGQMVLANFVKEKISASKSGIPLDELDVPYATLLIESKSYSLIRRSIGAELGRQFLLVAHDVSLLQSEDEDVPNWPDFFTSDVFTHSMTRSSEGYFSFRHGALVLAGRRTSGVDAQQLLSVDLTRNGPKLHFEFAFEASNVLRGRIAVVVGKNGCGKTSSLSRLAAGLATDKRQGVSFSKRPDVNQVLVFAHSGALRLFKQRRDRPGAASVRVFALDPASSLRSSTRERHTKLLVDIARSVDYDFHPLREFKNILEEEFPDLDVYIPIREDAEGVQTSLLVHENRNYVNINKWMRGGEARQLTAAANVDHENELLFLDHEGKSRSLSLGQAAFLNFSLNALANAGPASAILIDEPENFLHPNLISRFMRILHRIVEETKSIAILSTHSPFVVREVQSIQVHVIRQRVAGFSEDDDPDGDYIRQQNDKRNISFSEVVHPRLQTLGANVASISNEVFGDDLPEHLFELVLRESNIKTMPFEQILEQFAGQMSTEALMYLRRRQSLAGGDSE